MDERIAVFTSLTEPIERRDHFPDGFLFFSFSWEKKHQQKGQGEMQWSLNGCRNKEKIGKTAVGLDDLHLKKHGRQFF